MTLFQPEPFSSEVNRLFNTLFSGAGEQQSQRWMPAMDLVEGDDHFLLKADLPGLGEEDVSIEINDNTLTVSGERRAEHEERQRGWYRVERSFGRFSRSLTLPEGVNPEAVSASFERGVLSIRIPKPEERQPRRVTISPGASAEPREQPTVEGTASQPAPVAGGERDQPEGPGISPDAPPVDVSGGGQGGEERDQTEAPGIGSSVEPSMEPPVGGETEDRDDVARAHQGPSESAAVPEQAPAQTPGHSGAVGSQHPAQADQPSGDEPGDPMATRTPPPGQRGVPEPPKETSATTPGQPVEDRYTGQGGLDRESVIERPGLGGPDAGSGQQDKPMTEGQERAAGRGPEDEPELAAGRSERDAVEEGGGGRETASYPTTETPEEHPDPGDTPPAQGPG